MTAYDMDMLPDDEERDGRICETCFHYEACPCGCRYGMCHEYDGFTLEDDVCDSWMER